jgi:hypothetical protein
VNLITWANPVRRPSASLPSAATARWGLTYPPTGGAVIPGQPRATFYEALVAWYEGDAEAVSAVPGGLVDGEAAPSQVFPYGRYWGMENQEPASLEDEEVEITLSVYATDDNAGASGEKAARAAGHAFRLRLLDPLARGEWRFLNDGATWRESGCQWVPPGTLHVVGKSSGGRRVWRYDMWFKFFLTKTDS